MPQLRTPQSAFNGSNPFLESDLPDSEAIYEPTPFGIAALTNVDHLMNEIFQEVEQTLERESVLPNELHEEPEPKPAPPLLMSPGLAPPPASVPAPPVPSSQDDLLNDPDLEELLVREQEAAKPRKSGSGILLSAVLATLILTGGLFAAFKFRLYQMIPGFSVPVVAEGDVPPAAVPELAQIGKDQQFLEYVGRSLDRIARTATRSSDAGTIATLPSAPSGAPSPSIIERYVPVYQPPLFGSFTNPPGTTPSTPQSSVKAAAPSASIAPRSVAPVRVPPAPIVRPPAPRAVATPAQPLPSPIPVAAIAPNVDLSETHALIGLLELGDRSAALLEVNGVPQRIQVGETIGASGWKIMSISNQTAIIQRNSEVRSIYVGQKF